MQEILESFSSLGLGIDVTTILLRRYPYVNNLSYRQVRKAIRREIKLFISQGVNVNGYGILFAASLASLGFREHDVYLAIKITELGVTTHHFSLLAESYSSVLEENKELLLLGKKVFTGPSFRNVRICLAILSEIHSISIEKEISSLRSHKESDIKDLSPLLILLIRAASKY